MTCVFYFAIPKFLIVLHHCLLDICFVPMVSMMVIKMGVGEDAGSTSRATSINRGYFILHMVLAQHAEQIKLDILVLENQILSLPLSRCS
jgi:hypothetical protein